MLFGHIPGSNMHLVFANMSIKCTYKNTDLAIC